jgi:hypothetical protein
VAPRQPLPDSQTFAILGEPEVSDHRVLLLEI